MTFFDCKSKQVLIYLLKHDPAALVNFDVDIDGFIIDGERQFVRWVFMLGSVLFNLLNQVAGKHNLEGCGSVGPILLFDHYSVVATARNGLG